ncbi:MAG: hypothetical protein SPL64_04155 [Bacteroidaceae bacterium]|nr:hypothetical protein [Bacteroidaceae bacterium]
MSTNKIIILTAQVISLLFSPFYLPVLAFAVLFVFSYLNLLPMSYKVVYLLMVWFFTVLLPRLFIYTYRRLNGWTRHQLGARERRVVPYVLSIACYAVLLYLMYRTHQPRFTIGIIVAALAIQIVCALINPWFKVSTHAAASGGVVGAIIGFSQIFAFDPTLWLCLSILLCGLVCSSRLILRQHTLSEVGYGALIGVVCGMACVLLV